MEANMQHYTNPLDSVRIASPCSSDWNAMYGNERMRFCSECKLNVYKVKFCFAHPVVNALRIYLKIRHPITRLYLERPVIFAKRTVAVVNGDL